MNGKLILPLEYAEITSPLVFLAGPIQGSRDWQKEAINFIRKIAPEINIANPRRKYLPEEFVYEKQVDWETYYLRRAGKNGCVMFWLAKEFKHECDRAYAQTSRFELGEWKVMHQHEGAKLVVGIENGFNNARYIKRRLCQDCPNVPVLSDLEKTCRKATELARHNL